jgi:two-component system, chemotaxis family, response regulator Rcp1
MKNVPRRCDSYGKKYTINLVLSSPRYVSDTLLARLNVWQCSCSHDSVVPWGRRLFMAYKQSRPVEVLLVEDNPGDVRLTQEALKDGRVLVNLTVAYDGVEALDILRRTGSHANKARPDLILLDLNLPKKNGREVLEVIKADDDLKRIPVIVMTTSKAEQDIHRAYHLNANCYVTKPVDLDEFLNVVRSIEDFWLTIVTLPQ